MQNDVIQKRGFRNSEKYEGKLKFSYDFFVLTSNPSLRDWCWWLFHNNNNDDEK